MPRYAREFSQCGIYHIMMRGIGKMDIFLDNYDRMRFLETIDRMMEIGRYEIYAYCLMNNHVHLLIKEGQEPIQRSFKRIGVSYAYYYNKKYNRVGHVFQDRFRSEVIRNDTYILTVARYIHNNPVKAGMVNDAEKYYWSSMRKYINAGMEGSGRINSGFLLKMLSEDENMAVRIFKEFSKYTSEEKCLDIDFKTERESKPAINTKSVIVSTLKQYGMDGSEIKSIQNKDLRNKIIHDIKEKTGLSLRELSKVLDISKDIIYRAL